MASIANKNSLVNQINRNYWNGHKKCFRNYLRVAHPSQINSFIIFNKSTQCCCSTGSQLINTIFFAPLHVFGVSYFKSFLESLFYSAFGESLCLNEIMMKMSRWISCCINTCMTIEDSIVTITFIDLRKQNILLFSSIIGQIDLHWDSVLC